MLVFLKHNKVKVAFLLGILVLYYFCLPRTIFDSPYSIIVESREGELLADSAARDRRAAAKNTDARQECRRTSSDGYRCSDSASDGRVAPTPLPTVE